MAVRIVSRRSPPIAAHSSIVRARGQESASIIASSTPPGGDVEPWMHETFEGGVLTAPFWAGNNSNSNGSIAIVSEQAYEGTHSMRFRFNATATSGDDPSAEQRIQLPQSVTEVWLQFMVRIPDNYEHRAIGGANNNKFLTLWAENYSAANEAQFYLSLERTDDTTSRLDIISIHGDDPRYPSPSRFFGPGFITPADFGQWLQVRVYARIAVDGEIKVWKNGALHVETGPYNMTRAATGGQWDYFRHGYFMGWSNSGYAEQTDFYWDDIRWYLTDPGWGAQPFFSDSFDNGMRNPANGFLMFPNAGSPTVVSGVSHSGNYALQFHFPGKPGNDEWVEERFTMGRQLNEVWLEFWIHIPSNYYHRDNGADNNKFFAMWGGGHDAYTVGGRAKVVLELWHTAAINGDSRMRVMINPAGSVTSETLDYINPVITESGPMFRGTWNRFRYYAKVGDGPNQGAIKVWIGDTLMYSNTAVNLFPSPANAPYFDVGYFMGWANSAYAEDTTFHIDDVSFYDEDPGW